MSANPANAFTFAMGSNIYQTKNYFIAAYHYVQCFGTDLIVPSSTAEVAQAMAHYYKRAQVCHYPNRLSWGWTVLQAAGQHSSCRRCTNILCCSCFTIQRPALFVCI